MKDSNKLVVKVKYQGSNQDTKMHSGPAMITEWYIGRIGAVVVIVLLLIGGIIYFFNADSSQSVDIKLIAKVLPELKKESIKAIVKPAKEIIQNKLLNIPIIPSKNSINTQNKNNILSIKSKVISNKYVARAVLVSEINNKDPVGEIILPLVVKKDQASGVFYFTEIINMKGKTLFHQWQRDGNLVYERKVKILGNRWRVSTSKLITYSKTGTWTVRLVDRQGVVFNKIEFEVVK